jgi:sec-independent protein translocase protein TatB
MEKLLTLTVLAAILIGPDKLPQFAVDAARFLQKIRGMSQQAMSEFKGQLGPEFADMEIKDLNPKRFLANHLNDLDDLDNLAGETKNIAESAVADIRAIVNNSRIDPDLL